MRFFSFAVDPPKIAADRKDGKRKVLHSVRQKCLSLLLTEVQASSNYDNYMVVQEDKSPENRVF